MSACSRLCELIRNNNFLLMVVDKNIPLMYSLRYRRREPKRKPIWLPMAPSKLFRINKPPELPKDEMAEIRTLTRLYKCQLKSIRNHLYQEYMKSIDVGSEAAERVKQEEAEHLRLMEENQKENERLLKLRNERTEREFNEYVEKLLQKEWEIEEQKKEERRKLEELVLKEKARSGSFITEESIDEAIEHAINNPVNHNFAIDLNGNIFWEDKENIPRDVEIYRT